MGKQIINGTIEKIFFKDKEEDQWGNIYFVSAKVGDNWVGFGAKKKPVINVKKGGEWYQLQEGDTVEVVAETNQKGYLQAKSGDVTVKEASDGASVGSSNRAGSGGNGASRPQQVKGGDDRQDSIMRQSALGYAATVVGNTLTSKSDLDQAAMDVVRLAEEYFFPYSKYGTKNGQTTVQDAEAKRQEQMNQQNHQSQVDNGDFDDDVPF